MYSKISILALAGLAVAQGPAYGGSTADPSSTGSAYPSGSASAYPSGSASAYPSSSVAPSNPGYGAPTSTSSAAPTGSAYPSCWSACFAKAGIQSEQSLCGNTEVDACIQETCSSAEDEAYWSWYDNYCPAVTTTTPTSTAPVIPTQTVDTCWAACFAQYDVSSEQALCGNTEVDQCIQENCTPQEDEAYWSWYDSYCTTTVTTVQTTSTSTGYLSWTTPASATTTPTGAWSSPTGAWTNPASYTTPSGTGSWSTPTPSTTGGWVPPTGAGEAAKPAFGLFAGLLALVALF